MAGQSCKESIFVVSSWNFCDTVYDHRLATVPWQADYQPDIGLGSCLCLGSFSHATNEHIEPLTKIVPVMTVEFQDSALWFLLNSRLKPFVNTL